MAREKGISAAHYDMIYLNPIDETILREIAEKKMPVVTVEDASVKGGLGTAVTEWFAKQGVPLHIKKIGVAERHFVTHGTVKELYELCSMNAPAILEAIENVKTSFQK